MKSGKFLSKEDLIKKRKERCNSIRNARSSHLTKAERKAKEIFDGLNLSYEEQYPISTRSSFILIDFYLPDKKVAIELDGSSHDNRKKSWQSYNKWREKIVKKSGMALFRFRNEDILKNPDNFREFIYKKLHEL